MINQDDELLRLVQSGLPPDELEAQVLRLLVKGFEEKDPTFGALLRAAAVPRRLDTATVGLLRGTPDDEPGNRTALKRLADLSFVLPDPEGKSYTLHEETRALLLETWQTAGRRPRYEALSRALGAHFQEQDPLEALYHRFVFDPGGAFAGFERRFWGANRFYRRAECGALVLTADRKSVV